MGNQQTKAESYSQATDTLTSDQLLIIKKQFRSLVRPLAWSCAQSEREREGQDRWGTPPLSPQVCREAARAAAHTQGLGHMAGSCWHGLTRFLFLPGSVFA
jgi:hypothetical protein